MASGSGNTTSSSSALQPPMNLLKSVRAMMHAQFADVDVQRLARVVTTGLRESTSNPPPNAPTPDTDADDRAQFKRLVGDDMDKFAGMMLGIAPALEKYGKMVDASEAYLAAQAAQARYLIAMLDVSYAIVVITLFFLLYTRWSKAPTLAAGLSAALVLSMGFYALHALIFSMRKLMKRRLAVTTSVDTSTVHKYKKALSDNLFVRFAAAYAKGNASEFVDHEARVVLQNEADASTSGDVILNFCASSAPAGGGAVATSQCLITPCDSTYKNDIAALYRDKFLATWARAKSRVAACDVQSLNLLQALADVDDGTVFETSSPYGMWTGIQTGIDQLRAFTYRRLDVDAQSPGGGTPDPSTALAAVRDKVVPALELPAMESTDLVPQPSLASQALHSLLDASYASKDDCWRAALNDSGCAWAYYVPCKGGVLGTSTAVTASSSVGVLPIDGTWLKYSSKPTEGVFLAKRRSDVQVFVLGHAPQSAAAQWTLLQDGLTNLDTAAHDCLSSSLCGAVLYESDDKFSTRGGAALGRQQATTAPAGAGTNTAYPSYKELYGSSSSSDIATQRSLLRVTPAAICEVNASSHSFSTFFALQPYMTDEVLSILKAHHGHVHIAKYDRYIRSELQKHYGERFPAVLPLLNDALQRIAASMSALTQPGGAAALSAPGSGSGSSLASDPVTGSSLPGPSTAYSPPHSLGTYVSSTRFDEKVKALSYTNTKELAARLGGLALVTRSYMHANPGAGADRTAFHVSLLWGAAAILVLLLSLALYNLRVIVGAVHGISATASAGSTGPPDWSVIFRNLAMSVTLFIFGLVVLGAVISRSQATQRFNAQIADDNGKRLVAATSLGAKLAFQRLEYVVGQLSTASGTSRSDQYLRSDLADFYRKLGFPGHAARVCPACAGSGTHSFHTFASGSASNSSSGSGGTLVASGKPYAFPTSSPDLEALFLHMRTAIEKYDSCNTITVPNRPPFPAFEIVIYTLVAAVALAMLFYSYAKIDPLGRVRNIHTLNEVRDNIRSGMPSPDDLRMLADCLRAKEDVWSLVLNITVIIMVVLILVLVYVIAQSSANYQNSLYMSALYSEGRCRGGPRMRQP